MSVYQLRIDIKGAKPPIWRRILVEDHLTFANLHQIIQSVMGWYGYHLHVFNVGHLSIGPPSDWDDFSDIDSESVVLSDYLYEGFKFSYTYDFGDDWEHKIKVEKVLPKKKGQKYPYCIKGKNCCPPEDCGGIWGYADLLEVLSNKKHPDYEDLSDRIDENFDPTYFDLDEINDNLASLTFPKTKKRKNIRVNKDLDFTEEDVLRNFLKKLMK